LALGYQTKRHNLAVQELTLRKRFPESQSRIKRSELIWECDLQPSPLSAVYRVCLRYRLKGIPKVNVLTPQLQMREDDQPPHMYSYAEQRLCLYLPEADEWDGSMLLAKTVIPWTCEWLLQYEVWLVTGEWRGPGKHPGGDFIPE